MYYTDYDKEFKSGQFTITRREYAALTISMIAEEMSDEQMQSIVNDIDASMRDLYTMNELEYLRKYREGKRLSKEKITVADDMSGQEFIYFEQCAVGHGMRYWEDLTEEEYKLISESINSNRTE
jgi:hypothetical protein